MPDVNPISLIITSSTSSPWDLIPPWHPKLDAYTVCRRLWIWVHIDPLNQVFVLYRYSFSSHCNLFSQYSNEIQLIQQGAVRFTVEILNSVAESNNLRQNCPPLTCCCLCNCLLSFNLWIILFENHTSTCNLKHISQTWQIDLSCKINWNTKGAYNAFCSFTTPYQVIECVCVKSDKMRVDV